MLFLLQHQVITYSVKDGMNQSYYMFNHQFSSIASHKQGISIKIATFLAVKRNGTIDTKFMIPIYFVFFVFD